MQQIAHAKFSKEKWGSIEYKLDPFSLLVLNTLGPLGDLSGAQKEVTQDHGLQICGDPMYSEVIRPKLAEKGIVIGTTPEITANVSGDGEKTGKKTNTKKGKKGGKNAKAMSKADEIRFKNTLKKTHEAVEDTLSTINRSKKPSYGFNSNIAELRISTLMFVCSNALTKEKSKSFCYELIVGMLKSKKAAELLEGISRVALKDMDRWIDKMTVYVEFSVKCIFSSYPRLILSTDYDKVFPTLAVRPYKSQLELMDHVKAEESSLIFYNAMIGAGKTTSVIPLAHFCRSLNREKKAAVKGKGTGRVRKRFMNSKGKTQTQVLFCCSVEPVRYQVATLAYNAHIPFAIATVEDVHGLTIRNHYSALDSTRELIVSDLISTLELLRKSQDYILFLDEPTVAADQEDHPITEIVMEILSIAPRLTVLSSATMPEPEEIPEVIEVFKNLHKEASVVSMRSREALIGCEIITSSGTTLSPHTHCETVDDLRKVLKVIENNAFLGRLYTAPVVYRFKDRLDSLGVPGLPDVEKSFEDVTKVSQIFVQEVALQLLYKVIDFGNDEIVKKACEPISALLDEVDDDSDEETDFEFDTENEKIETEEEKEQVSFARQEAEVDHLGFGISDVVEDEDNRLKHGLFTKYAHRYVGGCLICVDNPFDFSKSASENLLRTIDKFPKLMKSYETAVSKYQAQFQRITNSVKSEDVKTKQLQELQEQSRPRIPFPDFCQINTKEHMELFAGTSIAQSIEKGLIRSPLPLESIDYKQLSVPDWVLALLFAGVGIYHQNHPSLSSKYLELVLDLTAKSQLSFLVSDSSISYGANYPFYHVVIEDEMASKRSMRTLFQLMGRAGRVGKSWTAKVHLLGKQLENRMVDYVHGKLLGQQSTEAKNMIRAVERMQPVERELEEEEEEEWN